MHVGGPVLPTVDANVAWFAVVGHMLLRRDALAYAAQAVVTGCVRGNYVGPRVGRVRELRHLTKRVNAAVVESSVDELAIGLPVATAELRTCGAATAA